MTTLLRRGIHGVVTSLAVVVALQTDRLVLAHFRSAEDVAIYGVYAQLASAGLSVLAAPGQYLWSEFERLAGLGRSGVRLLKISLRIYAIIGIIGAATFALSSSFLVRLAGGPGIEIRTSLALGFAAFIVVISVHTPSAMSLMGVGFMGRQIPVILVMAALNLALSIILTRELGIYGPILSSVIVVGAYQAPITARRAFDRWSRGEIALEE